MSPRPIGDRWALVTGAARRVGRAIVLELADAGLHVAIHYRHSRREAEALAEEVRARGQMAIVGQADLANAAAVTAFAAEVERATGGVSVLVNNASNYLRTPWSTLDEAAWDRALDVNLKAPYLLSIPLGDAMRARGDGTIVNLVDWSSERPYRDYLPYTVAKAGLIGLTRALAKELAPQVRVNAIAPGPVLLPEGSTADYAASVERATPLGLGTPESVARAVRFLVLDATYTTGAILHVDGGRTIA